MNVGILGASGRMGQAVIAAAKQAGLNVTAAIVSDQSEHRGQPVFASLRYQTLSELAPQQADVLIDFSLPQALTDNLQHAQRLKLPIVICTTGLNAQQHQAIDAAAQQIPVLYAANTSVGITLLQQLVKLTSAALPNCDIEIIEAHHSAKRDAPSGTALVLGESAAAGRGQLLDNVSAGIRGDGVREAGSIGFSVIRAGDIIGEHSVLFAQPGERIELTHKVGNRTIFAQGAVQAAQWLTQQAKGRYAMADMLALNTLLKQLA